MGVRVHAHHQNSLTFELKTQPKPVLGYLPLAFTLPGVYVKDYPENTDLPRPIFLTRALSFLARLSSRTDSHFRSVLSEVGLLNI